ncbi:sulfotransferase domain-containing protein [Pseudohalioglobus sediminis]|uniref:sulfotransferase domain-containing protein n=1 Tax=Pseudohalioglobus sediminis TaxID=2606449 RepID=UPI0016600115|nr:sulfotransferase domain-containing protein [Pseudohalioglobus sediminis]
MAKRTRWLRDFFARPCSSPIFILGNQKSGTSAIASLLGEMTGKSVAVDLAKDFHAPAFQRVGRQMSLAEYRRLNAVEFSKDIIKEANLTPMFDDLRSSYSDARFVFVVRDPRTNIRSILQRLDLSGRPEEVDSSALQDISETWRLILDSGWLGISGDDYVTRLASRWQLFSDIASSNVDDFQIIRYEDFLVDKVGSIERLVDGLSLDRVHDIAEQTDIQYQAKGDHSVSLNAFFGARNLERIDAICKKGMRFFRYARGA